MPATKLSVPPKSRLWIEARGRHRLSHAHIQMARELGMNPKTFGGLDNHGRESWKQPLPDFIVTLYRKRFGRDRPARVVGIEDLHAERRARKEAKKAANISPSENSVEP